MVLESQGTFLDLRACTIGLPYGMRMQKSISAMMLHVRPECYDNANSSRLWQRRFELSTLFLNIDLSDDFWPINENSKRNVSMDFYGRIFRRMYTCFDLNVFKLFFSMSFVKSINIRWSISYKKKNNVIKRFIRYFISFVICFIYYFIARYLILMKIIICWFLDIILL